MQCDHCSCILKSARLACHLAQGEPGRSKSPDKRYCPSRALHSLTECYHRPVAYLAKSSCSLAQSSGSLVHCFVEVCTGFASCSSSLQGGHRSDLRHPSSDGAGCQAAGHSIPLHYTSPHQAGAQTARQHATALLAKTRAESCEWLRRVQWHRSPPCRHAQPPGPAQTRSWWWPCRSCSRVWQQVSTASSAFRA